MRVGKFMLTCLAVLFALPKLSTAADSEVLSGASHVVIGKVVSVYSRDEDLNFGVVTRYVIEIKVDKVEKGSGPQSGKMLYVHNWQIKKITDMNLLPGVPPRPEIPKIDDAVRLFLVLDNEGRYRAMFNPDAIKLVSQSKR